MGFVGEEGGVGHKYYSLDFSLCWNISELQQDAIHTNNYRYMILCVQVATHGGYTQRNTYRYTLAYLYRVFM